MPPFENITARGAVYSEVERPLQALDRLSRTRDHSPWHKVVRHTFPRERSDEAFAAADRGEVSRAAIGTSRAALGTSR